MTTDVNAILAERDIAIRRQVRTEYQEWLKKRNESDSSKNVHLFATEKIEKYGPSDYLGKNELEIVQILEG